MLDSGRLLIAAWKAGTLGEEISVRFECSDRTIGAWSISDTFSRSDCAVFASELMEMALNAQRDARGELVSLPEWVSSFIPFCDEFVPLGQASFVEASFAITLLRHAPSGRLFLQIERWFPILDVQPESFMEVTPLEVARFAKEVGALFEGGLSVAVIGASEVEACSVSRRVLTVTRECLDLEFGSQLHTPLDLSAHEFSSLKTFIGQLSESHVDGDVCSWSADNGDLHIYAKYFFVPEVVDENGSGWRVRFQSRKVQWPVSFVTVHMAQPALDATLFASSEGKLVIFGTTMNTYAVPAAHP